MKRLHTMREALSDPALLGDAMRGDSWKVWRILLIAAVGEKLSKAERVIFKQFTRRDAEPGSMLDTFLAVSGRRSGKTTAMAALVVYLACLCDWSEDLSLGERGLALYLAPATTQAQRAFHYARTFIRHSSIMSRLVEGETADSITLRSGVDIEVQAANWRHVRGSTCIVVTLDECAFLRSEAESANRDEDLVTALRPSLITTGGPMLLISSPGADVGMVHDVHRKHHGAKGDPLVLVVQSDSRSLNPRLSKEKIAREFERDPEAAEAEWGGRFRAPTTQYLARDLVERAVTPGITQRPPMVTLRGRYLAFVDVAGGATERGDSFAWAIGHERRQGELRYVVDLVGEIKPRFSSEVAVRTCAEQLQAYGIRKVIGDLSAKGWPMQAFARHGIDYSDDAPPSASDLYLHCVSLFTAAQVELLDAPRLVDQLIGLRRKVGSGGRKTVVHLRNGHDDVANAVCGLLWRLAPVTARRPLIVSDALLQRLQVVGLQQRRATARVG